MLKISQPPPLLAPIRNVYYTTPPLRNAPKMVPHNMDKLRSNDWPKTINSNTDNFNILKLNISTCKVQVFFDLKNPESEALVNWVKETVYKSQPVDIELVINANMTDKKEKRIAYAFWLSTTSLGRNTASWLSDGFRGSFKRSYNNLFPSVFWKEIPKSYNDSTLNNKINQSIAYMTDKGIADIAVSVNGEFITERPIIPYLNDKIRSVGGWIKQQVKNGVPGTTNFPALYVNNSLVIDTAIPPVKIQRRNYIPIDHLSPQAAVDLAKNLTSNPNHWATPEEKTLLGITGYVAAPFVFPFELNQEQIDFVQIYANYFVNCTGLDDVQRMFTQLWAGSQQRRGIERVRPPKPDPLGAIKTTNKRLTWMVIADPFAKNNQCIMQMMSLVASSGLASIVFWPKPCNPSTAINVSYIPVLDDAYDVDGELQTDPHWIVDGTEVKGVDNFGYSFDEYVSVENLVLRPMKDERIFIAPTTTSFAYGQLFKFDSADKPQQTDDEQLHILTSLKTADQVSSLKTMLYSAVQLSSLPVKVWINDPNGLVRNLSHTNVDFSVLSRTLPPFILSDTLAVFDCQLPAGIPRVMYVSPAIVFQKDPAVHLDLMDATLAAPLKGTANSPSYMNRNDVIDRFGRDFHSNSLIWIDMDKWHDAVVPLKRRIKSSLAAGKPGFDVIFNMFQLETQFLTLPENTAFCPKYMKNKHAKKAFSIDVCNNATAPFLEKSYSSLSANANEFV